MWDVGYWNVVAGRQEHTQRRRQWLSYKNTAIFIYKKRDSNPKNISTKNQDNPNPKNIETYTEQN